jgi:hypothetical protein
MTSHDYFAVPENFVSDQKKEKERQRKEIEADIAQFLAAGNKIKQYDIRGKLVD